MFFGQARLSAPRLSVSPSEKFEKIGTDKTWIGQSELHFRHVGGMIYDMLLAQCALKAKADTIYTWNVNHFQRLGPEVARRIKTP